MHCQIHCNQVGSMCTNPDVDLVCSWMKHYFFSTLDMSEASHKKVIKECSQVHFDAAKMDEILMPYINHPDEFFEFLRKEWCWIISIDDNKRRIIADENKDECICPLVRIAGIKTRDLCYCSEGFAELMFSKIFARRVHAKVISSVNWGDKHCVYEIILS